MTDRDDVLTALREAADRLRVFVREKAPGRCRVLSNSDCQCPLCDIDRLAQAVLARAPRGEAGAPEPTDYELVEFRNHVFGPGGGWKVPLDAQEIRAMLSTLGWRLVRAFRAGADAASLGEREEP